MLVAACLAWVDLRPEVDPLTGAVHHDDRSFGLSAADEAALEWALRLGERWSAPVCALTAGPPASDGALREALARGVDSALRVDLPAGSPSDVVAAGLAHALAGWAAGTVSGGGAPAGVGAGAGAGAAGLVVCCGDGSLERGSGAVPAFLADRLGAAQALGVVPIDPHDPPGPPGPQGAPDRDGPAAPPVAELHVERRLERGRRERLRLRPPAVLSVEGSTARLRRASLPGVLEAGQRQPTVIAAPVGTAHLPGHRARTERRLPYRPPPQVLPGPDPALAPRERILQLTGSLVERTPPRTLRAEPDAAAEAILEQLRAWGYLP